MYLTGGNFASRLPAEVKSEIRKHGLRNSHLLSIAPTGTISLAFADNASNGIEPPFSWTYSRKKRMADGTIKEYAVEDYAWRLYKHMGGDVEKLPDYFVTALEISAQAHKNMVAAVAPYIDTSISKTVNVPAEYPYEDFQDLYMSAWKAGLKGLATYRPNSVLGSVLSVEPTRAEADAKAPHDFVSGDANRRLSIKHLPALSLIHICFVWSPNAGLSATALQLPCHAHNYMKNWGYQNFLRVFSPISPQRVAGTTADGGGTKPKSPIGIRLTHFFSAAILAGLSPIAVPNDTEFRPNACR